MYKRTKALIIQEHEWNVRLDRSLNFIFLTLYEQISVIGSKPKTCAKANTETDVLVI